MRSFLKLKMAKNGFSKPVGPTHEYFFSLICAVYSACLVALPEHNWDRQCLAEIQTIWFWSSIGYNFAANLGSLII